MPTTRKWDNLYYALDALAADDRDEIALQVETMGASLPTKGQPEAEKPVGATWGRPSTMTPTAHAHAADDQRSPRHSHTKEALG